MTTGNTGAMEALQQENAHLRRQVSELQQQIATFQESRRFVENIADTIPDILYIYDLSENRNVYVNREIALTLGYTAQEIQAMGAQFIPSLLHPDDMTAVQEKIAHILTVEDDVVVESKYRMRHTNGEWRRLYAWEKIHSRTPSGEVHQVIGISRDITDQENLGSGPRARALGEG